MLLPGGGRWIAGLAAVALVSCSTYPLPRTVPPGQIRHGVVLHYIPAAYSVRLGVVERVDVGISSPAPTGIDIKWNPIRGATDIAINPGYQVVPPLTLGCAARVGGTCDTLPFVNTFRLPVLWGLNLHKRVSLVGEIGPVLVASEGNIGFLYQAAVGANMRTGRFALQPMIQASYDPAGAIPSDLEVPKFWVIVGASVTWGHGPVLEY
ncbi:MAG TPA: hypothetical protein VL137_07940 [Polyangiaceae bacterium]|nr:hypothetical protein [Polyangiaceae bacterium]